MAPLTTNYPCVRCKRECLSELLGTYSLVLIGPGSVIVVSSAWTVGSLEALIFVGLAFGTTVALVIIAFGKYSGAHINPAITLAHGIAGAMRQGLLVPYLCFQLLGGLTAGFTLRLIFGPSGALTKNLGSTELAAGISPIEGVILELTGTFLLSVSALIASSYLRNPTMQAFLVGATLFILILIVGPLTGAGFNPARSLGPSLASGYFESQYVYWVGPLAGAVLAGLIFGVLKRSHGRKQKKKLDFVCVC